MTVRPATPTDKDAVLALLDEFRADCMEQKSGKPSECSTARTGGVKIYDSLLTRADYGIFLLLNDDDAISGIITGYTCPMLRSGELRAEVEEFFVKKEYRGSGAAAMLMDAFFSWCKTKQVQKVNLESDNGLFRAHSFYKKYGFETSAVRFVKKLSN